jgi:hypothetical protein
MKAVVVLLLVANVVLGLVIYAAEIAPARQLRGTTDLNANKLLVVPLDARPRKSSRSSPVAPAPSAIAGTGSATCLEWAKIDAGEADRARRRLSALVTPDRYSEQRVEAPTRFWVHIGPLPDAAEAAKMLTRLKEANIKDAVSQADHAISLALYEREEPAKRYQAELIAKGFEDVAIEGRALQVKELSFVIREPDPKLVEQLSVAKSEFKNSLLRAIPC